MIAIDRDEIIRLTKEYGGQWGINHTRRLLQLLAINREAIFSGRRRFFSYDSARLMYTPRKRGNIAGYGLLTKKSWARVLAMVVGILSLVNFPVGTAIGLYTLWVLTQAAATDYFAAPMPA